MSALVFLAIPAGGMKRLTSAFTGRKQHDLVE